jgi:hypothetical protein
VCQESLRLRRWTGGPWGTGLSIKMVKRFGKKMTDMQKIQKTKIVPLRLIGNICGGFAGNHLFKAMCLDEDGDNGWRYKYHGKMWVILNKPYKLWGTYYIIDI